MTVFESNADPDARVVYSAYMGRRKIEIVVKVQLRRQHRKGIRKRRKQKTKSTGDRTMVAGTLFGGLTQINPQEW